MKKRTIAGAVVLFALSGCMNPYRTNFNVTLNKMPPWIGQRLAPPSAKPELLKSDDIRSDNWKLFERGYVMIGFAKFDGPPTDVGLALSQGKAAGADIVAIQDVYTKTLTETVAVTQWPADQTTEVHEESTINGPRGPHTVSRTTEVSTSQSPETVYVPRDIDYYEHSATFWRKIENPLFGALVMDLSDQQKQQLQSNHGLVVRAIMTDSPAFAADLLKGDIILTINGEPAPSAQRFYQNLAGLAGKEVVMAVRRGATTIERRATLNH